MCKEWLVHTSTVTDVVDVTDREKIQQIKQIYKKAGVLGKKRKCSMWWLRKDKLGGGLENQLV